MGGHLRCFAALRIPEAARARIHAQLTARLDPHVLRTVDETDLHVTLLFLGQTPPAKVTAYKKALSKLDFPSFDLTLCGAGAFSERALYAAFTRGQKRLCALHDAVSALLQTGPEAHPEKRFVPHVTLARGRNLPDGYMARQVEKLNAQKVKIPFAAEHVQLLSSRLGGGAPHYTPLFNAPLSGPGPRARALRSD